MLPAKGPTGEALGNKCAQVTDENAILEGHKSGANADEFALQVNFDIMKIDEIENVLPTDGEKRNFEFPSWPQDGLKTAPSRCRASRLA